VPMIGSRNLGFTSREGNQRSPLIQFRITYSLKMNELRGKLFSLKPPRPGLEFQFFC
jgi:hypothetical protein